MTRSARYFGRRFRKRTPCLAAPLQGPSVRSAKRLCGQSSTVWDRWAPHPVGLSNNRMKAGLNPDRVLERYLDGNCETVWADLLSLGAEVNDEPYLTPALGV